ncbi:uncharacterized protein BJ212DRAFT_1353848 [Suillus subaureus]|uniref:Uncharacterized protein n=1 Tax=Suillus subaureus TaxID=48587 RepID=A0A9P7JE36_9AGAM|nr:uncharacterized protein BJ212DRAFT_1353848 [Suillus subaureus]KAG1816874.1 hypothetical protein BJ212DRAFT_1353848 [Suillus subaureus]
MRIQNSWKGRVVCSSRTAITSGIEMIHDTPTFGGLSHTFLTSFLDQLLKASVHNFNFPSSADPNHAGIHNNYQ